MYPSEETLIEAILMSFEVDNNEDARSSFMKEWAKPRQPRGIRSTAWRAFSQHRSAVAGEARAELFRLLDIVEPSQNASASEKQERLSKMASLRQGHAWRIKDSDVGPTDPFGTNAVHGAVANALHGRNYYPNLPVRLTLQQAGWFIHILDLAMNGQTLQTQKTHEDRTCMQDWEKVVVQEVENMHRFHIYGHSVDPEDLNQDQVDFGHTT
ncbi:hypothetical protein M758_UG213200 [Ceratodon purpureus]|nr:hypothetical protein M758_UG213200 [Ceratodon purpureus]